MVPPVCATVNAVPDPRTEDPLATVMPVVEAAGVRVKVMAAITPFVIGFTFIPLTWQV
jgi:hypothetical protein